MGRGVRFAGEGRAVIVLLPLAFLLLWVLALRREGPRKAICTAAVQWGVLLVLFTELLSPWGRLDSTGVGVAWGGTCLVLGLRLFLVDGFPEQGRKLLAPVRAVPRRFRRFTLGWMGLIVGSLGLLGVMGAPHGSDAMTYHLPRIMHWIQNGSAGHYSTWISRQLYNPPFAEFASAHVYLLYGGDRLLNLVQGFMLVGCMVAASLVTRRLGGSVLQQVFSAVFVLTLPVALLQAMTVKNGLVLSFWLLVSVLFLFDASRGGSRSGLRDAVHAGGAAGLAVLTKGTALVLLFPILAGVCVVLWLRPRREWFGMVALFVGPMLILNAGHYGRNASVYGHPLGSREVRQHHLTRTLKPSAVASNVLKNLTIQFTTPSRTVNRKIESGVRRVHDWMGISPEDRRTTLRFWDYRVFVPVPGPGKASGPLHALVFVLALVVLAVRGDPDWPVVLLAGGVILGFVLLCATVRWHPWLARLHLPVLVAAAPVAGSLLADGNWRRPAQGLIVLFLLEATVVMALNVVHPVVWTENNVFTTDRVDQYFTDRPSAAPAYRAIGESLSSSSCRHVGLVLRETSFEYPLWVILDPLHSKRTLRHAAPDGIPTDDFVSVGDRRDGEVCRIVCERREACGQLKERGEVRRIRRDGFSVWEVDVSPSSR